jgi:hypothetical protein
MPCAERSYYCETVPLRAQHLRRESIPSTVLLETAIVGDHNAITYKINTTQKQKYPPGCIGYNSLKANYISYLIDRYHDLKKWEVGGNGMNYAIFPSSLKQKFKIGATRTSSIYLRDNLKSWLPISRREFESVPFIYAANAWSYDWN